MTVTFKYEIGQTVYLVTDIDQHARIICGYTVTPKEILYKLCFGTQVSDHYDFEISTEVNVLKKVQ